MRMEIVSIAYINGVWVHFIYWAEAFWTNFDVNFFQDENSDQYINVNAFVKNMN